MPIDAPVPEKETDPEAPLFTGKVEQHVSPDRTMIETWKEAKFKTGESFWVKTDSVPLQKT